MKGCLRGSLLLSMSRATMLITITQTGTCRTSDESRTNDTQEMHCASSVRRSGYALFKQMEKIPLYFQKIGHCFFAVEIRIFPGE